MILEIVTNKVKTGEKIQYAQAAQKFVEDMVKIKGCRSSKVYLVADSEDVAIMSIWESKEARDSKDTQETFLKHKGNLKPHFVSNETLLLEEYQG